MEVSMSGTYKVAVATSDGKTVDSHFGHAQSFLIFEVDEESGRSEDIGERSVRAACSGGQCGSQEGCGDGSSPMDKIAEALSDVQYVLAARIGPHAIRALAKYGVTAFDIVLPIGEAISKINDYRKKTEKRKNK